MEDRISQYVFESVLARMERTIKRLWILNIILICLVAGMFIYEIQFEDVVTTTTQEVTQDSESGDNSFIGGDNYGTTDDKND